MGDSRGAYRGVVRDLKERDPLEDLGVNGSKKKIKDPDGLSTWHEWERGEVHTGVWSEDLRERDTLEDMEVNGRKEKDVQGVEC